MNQVRVAAGLRPLRFDGKLHAAARAHSADMMRRGYFAHGAFTRRISGFHVRAKVVAEAGGCSRNPPACSCALRRASTR